jgi:hypothetical protein
MSFYQTTNNMQSGQSWTLEVAKDATSGKTRVSCAAVPELVVEDDDQRFAVQEMRRQLDDYINRGSQTDRSPMLLHGPGTDTD